MSSSPDRPVLSDFLWQSGQRLASQVSASGQALASVLDSAEREAKAVRAVAAAERELAAPTIAPWKTLAEQYEILEDELRARILRISTNPANFSAERAASGRRRPGNILPGCLPMAQAALDADEALRALRFRLVPAHLSEEEFWRCYFWHVANVKCELLHDWRTANGARRAAVMEDESMLSLGDSEERGEAADPDSGFDPSDLDAEFERLVSSPTPA